MPSKSELDRLRCIVGAPNVLTDLEDRLSYSYDGTAMMKATPGAVVIPTSGEQIAQVIALANEAGLPIITRGSGTGLSGGSVPLDNGIVLSTLRLNRILEIDEENLTATVEPGVITADLHQAVESIGLFYPPDPGSMKVCTLGGNVAENAGGLRGLKYGVTRDYVMGLEVVLPNGQTMWTGGKCPKDVAGYDLRQILVGSEGTLGVFTKILVKLVPKPAAKRTLLAVFPTMEAAAATVAAVIAAKIIPATMEFLDQTTIACVESYVKIGLPTDAGAILLMESDGHQVVATEQSEIMHQLALANGASSVQLAKDDVEAARLSSARRMAFPALARMRPTTVLEDVSVPRSRLVEMVTRVREIAKRENLMIGTFGHAGDGNLHPTILLDERDADEVARMHRGFDAIVQAALELGGTLTGEHGVGLLKRDFLERYFPKAAVDMMKNFRRSMDPNGILNPGKMFHHAPRREGQLPRSPEHSERVLESLKP
jgi:glycolate oxidase